MLRVYTLKQCSTCRKATRWLTEKGHAFAEIPVRETPPPVDELRAMAAAKGNIRKLLNTSSQDYRDAKLKDRLGDMTDDEVFALLQENGNLVKRPFLLLENGQGLTGFREPEWTELLG